MDAKCIKDDEEFATSVLQALVDNEIIPQESSSNKSLLTIDNIWKLYTKVTTSLENQSKQQNDEMKTVQEYVQHIKRLSDERDKLTDEFEQQNSLLKDQLIYLKNKIKLDDEEVEKMFLQEHISDMATRSTREKVAYLLIVRANLMKQARHGTTEKHETNTSKDLHKEMKNMKSENSGMKRQLGESKQMIEYLTHALNEEKIKEKKFQKQKEEVAILHEDEVELLNNSIEKIKENHQHSNKLHNKRITELENENEKLRQRMKQPKYETDNTQMKAEKIIGDLESLLKFGEEQQRTREEKMNEKTRVLEEKVNSLQQEFYSSNHSRDDADVDESLLRNRTDDDELDKETLKMMLADSEELVEKLKKQKIILEDQVRSTLRTLDNGEGKRNVSYMQNINNSTDFEEGELGDIQRELCVVRKQWSNVTTKYNKLKERHKKKIQRFRTTIENEREERNKEREKLSKEVELSRLALKAELSWKEKASDMIKRSEEDRRSTIKKLNQLEQFLHISEKKLFEEKLIVEEMKLNNTILQRQLDAEIEEKENVKKQLREIYENQNQEDSALESTGESIDLTTIRATASTTLGGVNFDEDEETLMEVEQKAIESSQKFSNYLRLTPDLSSISPR